MTDGESIILPDYESPPVNEVVCGISFEKLDKFKGPHIGLFWQKVRDNFPIIEHAQRLEFGHPDLDLTEYMPRMWFINELQNMLIQLQNNKFFFNWRRMQAEETYPRYRTIIQEFKENLGVFHNFLKEEGIGTVNFEMCELTYINHIPKGEGWDSLADINRVFRDISWSSDNRFLPDPIGVGGQARYALPDEKGRLQVTLQSGSSTSPPKQPIIILQMSASGLGKDKSEKAVWEWFELAHEWIVRGFADLTETTIQKDIWRRSDL